jgi:membrane-associated protein
VEVIRTFIDYFLHLDKHLNELIADYGKTSYLILFMIIFGETGLVVTPFLPGDSLLFAAGALAASGGVLQMGILFPVLLVAAIVGDLVNYHIGFFLGHKIPFKKDAKILKKDYLDKTHRFYEKYGGKTIVLARFVPIIRTFAPFVAGLGKMGYFKFAIFNVTGGLAWISMFLFGGYYFGNIPVVKHNFTLVIIAIIIISILPGVYEYLKARQENNKKNNIS